MREDRKSEKLNEFETHNDSLDLQLKSYAQKNSSL